MTARWRLIWMTSNLFATLKICKLRAKRYLKFTFPGNVTLKTSRTRVSKTKTASREKRQKLGYSRRNGKRREVVPAIEAFAAKQTSDAYCCKAMMQIGMNGLVLHDSHIELLVQRTKFDSYLQSVVEVLLEEGRLHAEHYPSIDGHPGERWMLDKMQ